MLFCTFEYLLFFPIVTFIYFLLPKKFTRYWLLAVSLFFYACWKPEYLALILISILITFFSSLIIEKEKHQKLVLLICIVSNIAILFFFKYFNFVAETINQLIARDAVSLLDVALPVGISFYTFQAIGYTIDVYWKRLKAEKNLITYATFVCYFPQLVAGPIERADNLLPQIRAPRKFDYNNIKSGLILIGWGFFMKLVIADRAAIFVDNAFSDYSSQSSSTMLLACLVYTIQKYCDFAGYSIIAVGSAQVMGITLMKNFASPLYSKSISEYWTRWHISLSSWLNEYIFVPVSWKLRDKKFGIAASLIILFLISGIWHGANWTFIVWGLINGLYAVAGNLTKRFRNKIRKRLKINEKGTLYSAWRVFFIFLCVVFVDIFFRVSHVSDAFGVLNQIFTAPFINENGLFSLGLDMKDFIVLACAIILLAIVDKLAMTRDIRLELSEKPLILQWTLYLLLIAVVAVFGVYGPAYDSTPFIYFQF